MEISEIVSKYGFPIIATLGLGYFVYYVWVWTTKIIRPVIGQTHAMLTELIDQIRMLDNDLIRLNQKLTTIVNINLFKNKE